MPALVLSDLHLTSLPRDSYRWRIFPWLEDQIAQLHVRTVIILGDLTEARDYHSAQLVNRVVDSLVRLRTAATRSLKLYLLRGNHDGTDPACPYFRFLRQIPSLHYMDSPCMGPLDGRENVLFLPHTREPEQWDRDLLYQAEVIFMHQTVDGAVGESNTPLRGVPLSIFRRCRAAIWSGDLHVPQKVGPVEYVGAPYPIRFGDSFDPRVVLLENELRRSRDLTPPSFGRRMITLDLTTTQSISIKEEIQNRSSSGDQVKVKVRIRRAQFMDWEKIRQDVISACSQASVELCGLEVERAQERRRVRLHGAGRNSALRTPEQILQEWCERRGIESPVVEMGQTLLAQALRTS